MRTAVKDGLSDTGTQVSPLRSALASQAALWPEIRVELGGMEPGWTSTTSPTRNRTRSQPRNLLSIARLNIAKSRTRLSCNSRIRIVQMWRGFSGGFGPTMRLVFQAGR